MVQCEADLGFRPLWRTCVLHFRAWLMPFSSVVCEPQISWTACHLYVSIAICAIGTNEAEHDIAAPDQTCHPPRQVKPSGMGPGRSPASLVSLPVLVSASTKQFFLLLLRTPNINSSARGGSGCSAISHGLTEPDQGRGGGEGGGGGGGWIRGKAGSRKVLEGGTPAYHCHLS